jgi:hypothetical protein
MRIGTTLKPSNRLPLRRNLATATILTIVVVVVTAVASLAGLIFQTTIYPTAEIRQSFVANDILNLIIGLPILLGSVWLARRGQLIGLLFWPGALLYGLYNYIANIVGVPIGLMTIAYLIIVLLSGYITFDLFKNIDRKSVQAQLAGAVPVKTAGWTLIVFGILFIFRALGVMIDAGMNQTSLPMTELGVLMADIVLSLLCIAGGGLLLRRMPLGYVSGLGLLFATSMLFVGLILLLFLQPVLSDAPFVLMDVIVVAGMGLIFFIPFGLFLRGVMSRV